VLDVQLEWVVDGLSRMRSLRWIELEIEDADVSRDDKLAFCAELEAVLTQMRGEDDGWVDGVKVVFVEPLPEVVEVVEEEKWYVGEPGDDEWVASNVYG
jgi:hypothetical protein